MSFSALRIALASLFIVLLVTGCGGQSSAPSNQSETISGQAVKGLISNGVVNAYATEGDGSFEFVSTSRTNARGRFSINLKQYQSDLILLEVKADAHSRMLCDLPAGCIVPGSGDLAEFGESFQLPENFSLLGLKLPDARDIYISPLSHVIASTAAAMNGGISLANVEIAATWVQSDLKLEHNPLETETPDITTLTENLSESELTQGIMGASFFYYAFLDDWRGHTLTLDDLPLSDIFNSAADLAARLSELYLDSASETASQLVGIASAQVENAGLAGSDSLVIVSQPQSLEVVEGETVYLRVTAASAAPLSYQWYVNDQIIEGATERQLTINNAQNSDQGLYRVEVSDGYAQVNSLSAQVSVHANVVPLQISRHPLSQSLTPGQTLQLSVETLGGSGNLEYQWRKGGSIIPGAKSSSLSISNVDAQDSGSYSITITDGNRVVQSQAAVVNVTEALLPVTIHDHPQGTASFAGRAVTLYVNASGGGFLAYQWRKDGIPLTGQNDAYLTINPLQEADEGYYDVIVSNSQGSVISNPAQLAVIPESVPIVIVNHPVSSSVTQGESATFSVSAVASGEINYQWYHNFIPVIGANSSQLTITSATAADAGLYHVVLESGTEVETSFSAMLSVSTQTAVELSWDIPTQREDGSPLMPGEIQGYRIEYGTSSDSYTESLFVGGATNTVHRISGLDSGDYYFRIATIDSDGLTSSFTSPISVTVQ